jgi:hypothetical protein
MTIKIFFLYMLYIMSKSKRQVKRRMGTKKRRVVRRKTQKRKQTKRKGGDLFKRPPLPIEKTYRKLSVDAAIDPNGVLQTIPDTALGVDLGSSELGSSEPPTRRLSMPSMSSLSLPSFFSKNKEPKIIDPDVKQTMINNIKRRIASKKQNGEDTSELENQLAELQPSSQTMSQEQGRATNFMGQYGNP